MDIEKDHFKIIKYLEEGSIGKVFLVNPIKTNKLYAMKKINIKKCEDTINLKRVQNEKNLLKVLNHPFIINFHYSFEDEKNIYYIVEYCEGGDLFEMLQRSPNNCFTEDQARFYSIEILLALEYLHSNGILYLDLKPENILLHESGHIKLCDFDSAIKIEDKDNLCKHKVYYRIVRTVYMKNFLYSHVYN